MKSSVYVIFCYRYNDLAKKLKANVLEAVNELVRNFDAEFGTGTHTGDSFLHNLQHNGRDDEDDEDTIDSSFNHVNIFAVVFILSI